MPHPSPWPLRSHLILVVVVAVLPALALILILGPGQQTLGESLLLTLLAGGAAVGLTLGLGRRFLAPLRASEEYHRILFQKAPMGIFRFDPRGVIQDCNPAFAAVLGGSREALLGFSMLERVQNPGVREAIQEALAGRIGHQTGEYISVTAGRRSVGRLITYPITGDDGRPLGGIGLVEDITERHQMEVALRESEAHLELFFNQSRDAYYIATLDEPLRFGEEAPAAAAVEAALDRQRLTQVNLALAAQLGVPKTDLEHWTVRDLYRHDPDAGARDMAELLEHGHLQREIRQPRPDGPDLWLEWDCICFFDGDGCVLGHFGIRHDVSERKRTEAILRQGEQTTRNLFDAVNDAIFVHDLDTGAILDTNARALEMYGYSHAEILHLDVAALSEGVPPYTQAEALAWLRKAASGAPQVFEWRARDRSGRAFWVEVNMRRAMVGAEERLLVAVRDIEARKTAEAALRDAEAEHQTQERLFRLLFERSGDANLLIDGNRFVDCNQATVEILGATDKASVLGTHPSELSPPFQPDGQSSREKADEIIATAYRRGSHHFEWVHRKLDGTTFPVEVLLTAIPWKGKQLLHTTWRDRTEARRAEEQRRNLEAQFQQAQRLESLGVLAGGIAHDFNNLLTAVLGNLNLAQFNLSPESPAGPFLENAEKTVLKASDLTKQMLAYSGKGHFVVKLHDVNEAVQEMAHLLQVSISKKATLRLHLAQSLPPIEADGAQFQQVVMNLVTNASDALGDQEGIIAISTGLAAIDADYIATTFPTQSLAPGRYVTLEVSDTGQGMSRDVQARIFDPFFTTKPTGRGLGLSAMLGILRGHHAGLKIYSEVGRGSSFKAFFPAAQGHAVPLEAAGPPEEVDLKGTVLLVDDEPTVLETIGSALETLGLRVVLARDGLEALETLSSDPTAIDLVLMDLTMPRMDGREAFQAMRQVHPGVRVILSSGYNEQESIQPFLGKGLAGFLQKPYTFDVLRTALLKALR